MTDPRRHELYRDARRGVPADEKRDYVLKLIATLRATGTTTTYAALKSRSGMGRDALGRLVKEAGATDVIRNGW